MKITKGDYQTAMDALDFIREQGRQCILYIDRKCLRLVGLYEGRFAECYRDNTVIGVYDERTNIRYLQADIGYGLREIKSDYMSIPAKIGQTCGVPFGGLMEREIAL